MILVVGGLASGKRTYALSLGYPESDIAFDVHESLRDAESADAVVAMAAGKAVVTCAEVGSGIVPLDKAERAYRERVGRVCAKLAEQADAVVRMVCGIPVVLKEPMPCLPTHARNGSMSSPSTHTRNETTSRQSAHTRNEPTPSPSARPMELVLIRHGQTPGNGEKRYVGIVDQPLSEAGRAQAQAAGAHGEVGRVYVSVLRRTHETAAIMFPNAEQVVVDGIQEMDFGAFAGRTPDEMEDDPDYRAWVDGMCEGRCPGGESQGELTERVCAAMEALLREASARGEERLVMVAHGGTMMAFLSRYGNDPAKRYWDWLVGNCEGYRIALMCDDCAITITSIERW